MTFALDVKPEDFYSKIQPDFAAWSPLIIRVAIQNGLAPIEIRPFKDGVNLVACLDEMLVVKIFPPFHRHQWESEHRSLKRLQGQINLPLPKYLASGLIESGWTFIIMSKIKGESLELIWKTLSHANQQSLIKAVGQVMAQVHALPLGELEGLEPEWNGFLKRQKENCKARLVRLNAAPWMIETCEAWLAGALDSVPENPTPVILTGEYTPFNLLVSSKLASEEYELAGMIDFGDAMVGYSEYDFMGPALFLCAGDAVLQRALLDGYGYKDSTDTEILKKRWMSLQILHRYCDFKAQVRIENWESKVESFDELASLIWPL